MRIILILCVLALVTIAVACRGGEPPANSRPTPMSQPDAAEGGGSAEQGGGIGQSIALRLWTQRNDTFDGAYQALVDAYMAANPGVSITHESYDLNTYGTLLQDSLSAGTAADIVQIMGSTLCIYSPNLSPAPQAITSTNPQALFAPVLIGGFTCDGQLFGLPQESSIPLGLAVSKSSAAADVAWDFVRFATLDAANATTWNATTGTSAALGSN